MITQRDERAVADQRMVSQSIRALTPTSRRWQSWRRYGDYVGAAMEHEAADKQRSKAKHGPHYEAEAARSTRPQFHQ
jgi:hypothetical protein